MTARFAGPWEVDVDLDYDTLDTLRRGDSLDVANRLRTNTNTDPDTRIEDARHLLGFNPDMDPADLAARLGVSESNYERRIKTNARRVSLAERRFIAALDRTIADGRPFTVEALPDFGDSRRATELLEQASKAGRIRQLGKRRDKYAAKLWQPIVDEAEVAA